MEKHDTLETIVIELNLPQNLPQERSPHAAPESEVKSCKYLHPEAKIIVIYIEIECEIDIRTLTSHQVLGQILDQMFDQVLSQILDQILDQVFGQILDQFLHQVWSQGFWNRKDNVQFYWDKNRSHAN